VPTDKNIYDYLAHCTVKVHAGSKRGSGFFGSPKCVFTCEHTISETVNDSIKVVWQGNDYPAYVLTSDPENDVAVLRVSVEGNPLNHRCAFLHAAVRQGDPLFVRGFPESHNTEYFEDSIRFEFEGYTGDGKSLLKLTGGQAVPGFSGAPVLNLRTGAVCGILRTSRDPFSNLGGRASSVSSLLDNSKHDREDFELRNKHREYHKQHPEWFECDGRGEELLFMRLRSLVAATRRACKVHNHRFLAPRSNANAVDLNAVNLLVPARLRKIMEANEKGPEISVDELLDDCRAAGSNALIIGEAGSGKSSALRFIAHQAGELERRIGLENTHLPLLLKSEHIANANGSSTGEVIQDALRLGNITTDAPLPEDIYYSLKDLSPLVQPLILIDGIDEVVNDDNLTDKLVPRIARLVADSENWDGCIVATSRPGAVEHVEELGFDIYELEPFEDKEVEALSRKWLGRKTKSFKQQGGALLNSGLLSSPLILTIALKLFEAQDELPTTASGLYGQLMVKCFEYWDQRVAPSKYDQSTINDTLDIYDYVALESLRASRALEKEWLKSLIKRYHIKEGNGGQSSALNKFSNSINFIEEEGVFLNKEQKSYTWMHSTFRDFFAASRLIKEVRDEAISAEDIIRNWHDANWGKTTSFALQLLSNNSVRGHLVRKIFSSERDERDDFLAGLMKDGTQLPQDVIEAFVQDLVEKSKSEEKQHEYIFERCKLLFHRTSHPFELLLSLAHDEIARRALEKVVAEPGWADGVKKEAQDKLNTTTVTEGD
jgi:hypothetical protein